MNIILRSIYNAISDKKYNFYVFTLLWITTLITWIPFIHTEIIFNPLLQKCSFFIHWFTTNETFLFSFLSFLFLIEAIVLMFLFISLKTTYYENEFQNLYGFLFRISNYTLLSFQLLKNIGVSRYGVTNILKIYTTAITFSTALCAVSLSINVFLIGLQILGYFYRSKPRKLFK